MADGVERRSRGTRTKNIVLEDLSQSIPPTLSKPQALVGCEKHETDQSQGAWGRRMSTSGRLSPEMMTMRNFVEFIVGSSP